MGALRKLRRNLCGRNDEIELLDNGNEYFAGKKMSEVLLNFAEPLICNLDDECFESAIGFAAICWNISFFPEAEQKKFLHKMLDALDKSDWLVGKEMESTAISLIERKKKFFAEDLRFIVNHRTIEEHGRERLLVMSTQVNKEILKEQSVLKIS